MSQTNTTSDTAAAADLAAAALEYHAGPTPGKTLLLGLVSLWALRLFVHLVKRSIGKPEVLVEELNLDLVEAARTHWPFLRDRRIDAYQGLLGR